MQRKVFLHEARKYSGQYFWSVYICRRYAKYQGPRLPRLQKWGGLGRPCRPASLSPSWKAICYLVREIHSSEYEVYGVTRCTKLPRPTLPMFCSSDSTQHHVTLTAEIEDESREGCRPLSRGTQELGSTTSGKNFSRFRELSRVLRLDLRRLFCRISRLSLDPRL